jgi:hypothetical protein
VILDELCATTGWQRDHARKALRQALGPRRVATPRRPRPPTYDGEMLAALRKLWAMMDAPAGKRMAPVLPEITAGLRACGELEITDDGATKLSSIAAATNRPQASWGACAVAAQGPPGHQAGHVVEVPDPHP